MPKRAMYILAAKTATRRAKPCVWGSSADRDDVPAGGRPALEKSRTFSGSYETDWDLGLTRANNAPISFSTVWARSFIPALR